jgi:4-alpha-glucanotransferase
LNSSSLISKRRAGVLCHITSLPNKLGFGDLGRDAYNFIDFLSSSGFGVWQILPLGPTHPDLCPYQSLSAHAGNPQLINLEWLVDKGWLSKNELSDKNISSWNHRLRCLQRAYIGFTKVSDTSESVKFKTFIDKHNYWLDKYAIYIVLHEKFAEQSWTEWPNEYRDYESSALDFFCKQNQSEVDAIKFQQYVFFSQWEEIKKYANKKGISIIGDMPIFVAHDSAEVWANRKYFALDATGHPNFVAGVPPDYFSPTGQRWGNPHYQWQQLEKDDFSWWVDRITTQSELYDAIRIDHFRGLVEYWEIPANEATAVNGRWVTCPGRKLLQVLTQTFPNLYLIAEDLGIITPDVVELRDEFSLPGMNILQFAFDGNSDNPYLPKNHKKNSVAYTATHDNDTTLSWYESLSTETQHYVNVCINNESEDMPWPMIHANLKSVANLAIFPIQDLLGLGKGHRMNTPGTIEGNWRWQFNWNQIDSDLTIKLSNLLGKYNRKAVDISSSYSCNHTMHPVSNG